MTPDPRYYQHAKQWPLPGYSHMHASPADREQVIGTLKTAFLDGRLTKEEYEERVGRALRARNYGDLGRLTEDLPGPPPGHPFPRLSPPVLQARRRSNLRTVTAITLVVALMLVLVLATMASF